MPKLWACYEPDLIQYHEDRATAIALNSEEISAFLKISVEESKEEILSISEGVAQIRIEGVLSWDGPDLIDQIFGISGTSYASIIEAIDEAEENPDVHAIELIMDTPGGTVNGIDSVYQAVSEAQKPITAINTGMIASAGYWIASATDAIVAESAIVETGSIGVMVSGIDQTERLEREGIRVVDVVSENAPNKAPTVSTDEGIEEIRGRVNALERVFISRVAIGRRVSEEHVRANFGRGSVLIANDPDNENNDALSVGMIDRIEYIPTERAANQTAPVYVAIDGGENEGETMAEKNTIESTVELDKVTAEREDLSSRISRATPYLTGTEYPSFIRGLAVKVLNGEADPAILEGAVTTFDALNETKTTESAIEDSETTPEVITQPVGAPTVSEDGVIRNELDYNAAMERLRAKCGIVR